MADRKKGVAKDLGSGRIRRHGVGIADRKIGFADAQIEDRIGADDLQGDRWMRVAPERQPGNEPTAGEGVRAGHPEGRMLHILRQRCDSDREGIEAAA